MKITDLRQTKPTLKKWVEVQTGEVVEHFYAGIPSKNIYYMKLENGNAANLTTGTVAPDHTMRDSDRSYRVVKTELVITE